jgi:hypothetical protein
MNNHPIENDDQYKITLNWLHKFEEVAREADDLLSDKNYEGYFDENDKILLTAQKEASMGLAEEFRERLKEYENKQK